MTSESGAGDRDDEPFLSRWSRRKVAARTEVVPPAASVPAAGAVGAITTGPNATEAPATAPAADAADADDARADAGRSPEAGGPRPLPDLDSLSGVASDYREFMRPGVDEDTRRAALRKLFADPHFNRMDGLDVYIDDYGVPDPMPADMLAALAVTKRLIVDPAEETPEAFARRRLEAATRLAESPDEAASPIAADAQADAAPDVTPDVTVPDAPQPPATEAAATNVFLPPDATARTKPE